MADGSGTAGDPYIAETYSDIESMSDGFWILIRDIDCSDFGSPSNFSGDFDGKGYALTNFAANGGLNNYGTDTAPFYDFSGNIRNLTVSGISITNNGTKTAGLISSMTGGAVVNVIVSGTIVSTYASQYADVGGLVGLMTGGTIDKCYANVSVTGVDEGVGGFFGRNNGGTITNSYAVGAVDGGNTDYEGSFGGYNQSGTIDDCYGVGACTDVSVGGFCGENNGTITNCFWDTETTGQATSNGGTGKTTSQMKTQSTFTGAGWNFTTIWGISAGQNNGYPYLSVGISTDATVFEISIVQTQFHYVDAYGTERYIEGTPVV